MCGVCGIAVLDGGAADPEQLRAMREALRHRGPDSGGDLIDGPVGLGARRLAIIDLEGGDQPIANEDGTVHVVQNGEIYNYRELRAGLLRRGHVLRTRSDTEVLVHLYEERGPAFVEVLRGMFAIAVWDAPRRRLVLARDRFGIKPLYVAHNGGRLVFASELKALTPWIPRDLDLEALHAYLAFNSIPAPLTIFRAARKLPAGCFLVADDVGEHGSVTVSEYADVRPVAAEGVRREPEAELADELRERLRDSVAAHLVADVPVGVLLSGGIDSSTLTAVAALLSDAPVSTFTIGFEEASFDERADARRVARRYATDHHELVVRPDAAGLLRELAEVFDEPFGDSSAIPTYLVSKLAREHVKVALSGEGSDELFGGYYTYVADQLADRIGWIASVVRPAVELLPSSSGRVSFDYKAKRFARGAHLAPLERHHAWKEIFSSDERFGLLAPDHRSDVDPVDVYRARYARTEGAQPLARLQDVDRAVYLVDDLLVKTDRASMAHSLEVRVPFLDPVVAELALAVPEASGVKGFAKKRLLRRAATPLLPRENVAGKKRGFSIPAAAWLRGELALFAREVLSPDAVRRQGVFRPEAVSAILETHVTGREDLSRQLWGLLAFALWHDRYA